MIPRTVPPRSSCRERRAWPSLSASSCRPVDVRGPKEFAAAFSAMKRGHADAVILGVNTPFLVHRRHIAELAVSHRLPMMAPTKEYAEAGALVSYGTDYPDQFRRVAVYVDKILKGANPAICRSSS